MAKIIPTLLFKILGVVDKSHESPAKTSQEIQRSKEDWSSFVSSAVYEGKGYVFIVSYLVLWP